jgi:hypothetical protein
LAVTKKYRRFPGDFFVTFRAFLWPQKLLGSRSADRPETGGGFSGNMSQSALANRRRLEIIPAILPA